MNNTSKQIVTEDSAYIVIDCLLKGEFLFLQVYKELRQLF